MTPESFVALLEALAKFAWPVLAAVVIWKLLPSVREAVKSRGVRIKVGDLEVSLQDVSDNVQRDIADLQKKVSELRAAQDQQVRVRLTLPAVARTAQRPNRILWVDDEPGNNALEIARLQSEGISVTPVKSTSEALRELSRGGQAYGLVVSDMGRQERDGYNARAGLELLEKVRKLNADLPVVMYTSRHSASRTREEVESLGGQGITWSSLELFEMIRGFVSGQHSPNVSS